MDLAHRRLTPDFTLYMFLAEAWIAPAMIYACTTFGLHVFFPWGIPQLQSDWSLSSDDGLDYAPYATPLELETFLGDKITWS